MLLSARGLHDSRRHEPAVQSQILVAEHIDHVRESICRHLDLDGCQCSAVTDAEQAIHLAMQQPFDVIVTDIAIPPTTAAKFSQMIRRDTLCKKSAIIILTDRVNEPAALLALEHD